MDIMHTIPLSVLLMHAGGEHERPISLDGTRCFMVLPSRVRSEIDRRFPVQPAPGDLVFAPGGVPVTRERFAAIVREASRSTQPAPVSGWQPISTAPDEGCILVYDPGIGEYIAWRTFRGGWMSHHPDTRRNPTHWMPLPEVPR